MIVLIVNLLLIVFLVMLSVFRPGVGIAVALILGRHTFPDRVTPIVAAAPLLCVAALLGYRLSGRRLQLSAASISVSLFLLTVVLVGGFRHGNATDDLVRTLSDDKSFFLVVASVPLVLLANTLQDSDIRLDFLRSIVGVTTLLTLVMIAVGGGERSGALGGGPITLAMSIGTSILILVHYHDPLLPPELSGLESPGRIGLGMVFGVGILLSESRQPLLSLMLVLGIGSVAGLTRDRDHASSSSQLRRIRRLRWLSMAAILVATAGLVQLIFGDSDSRFALLANPSEEIARSRSDVWGAGVQLIESAGMFGHGFGATLSVDAIFLIPYPHNVFLELWSEVGPLMMVVFGIGAIFGGIRLATQGSRVFALMTLYVFLGAQVSGDLYNTRHVFVFLIAGLAASPQTSGLTTSQRRGPDSAARTTPGTVQTAFPSIGVP